MSEEHQAQIAALQATNEDLVRQLRTCEQRLQQVEAERQTTLAQFQSVEQQLTFLLDHSPLATIVWDDQFRVRRWSSQAEQLFGWPTAEVVGKTMYDWSFIFEADVEQVTDHAQALLQTGGSGICQNRNYCKDGRIIYCEWFNSVLLNEAGELVLFLSLVKDISDLKRLEAELRRQAQREKTLNRVIQAIRNSLDLDSIFQTTVTEVGNFLQIDYVLIHQFDEECQLWRPIAEYRQRPSLPSFLEIDILDPNNPVTVQLKQGKSVFIANTNTLEGELNCQIATMFPGAWFIMPIQVNAYPLTTIALAKQGEERVWPEAELELMTTIANQLAVAMQQAVLLQQVQAELGERQKAEQSLQTLNQSLAAEVQVQTTRLQVALSSVKMGIWEWDMVTNTDYWSPETYEILGLHMDERGYVLNHTGEVIDTHPHPGIFYNCIHPDDRAYVKQVEQNAIAQRIPFEVECRLLLADGQIRWIYERGACIFNEAGEAIKLVGMIMDISDRKHIEIALRQSEARLKEAQQVAHVGNWEFDVLTETITWSDELFRIFGLSPDGPPPTYEQLRQSYPPAERERHDRVVAQILATGEPYEEDFQIMRPDGSLAWTAVRGHAEKDEQGRVIRLFGTTMDVSDRKATEAKLQQAVEELEHLNRMKDDFLSTVSHELRTPITNMKLSIRMLEVSATQSNLMQHNPKMAQYLTVLSQECEREISLINDLLDLQRLEAGKHQGTIQTFHVPNWLSEFIRPFKERAQARQQTLTLALASAESIDHYPPTVTCELDSLERIVGELINNACKYTPPGHAIVIASQVTHDRWSLGITNFGIEIPLAEQSKIFDRFYRIPSHDPWKQGGTGLGLALVKKLVEHLGGTIQVESGSNQTCFRLTLPRTPIAPAPSSPEGRN